MLLRENDNTKGSFFAAVETRPQIVTLLPEIVKDRAGVVKFVGGRNEQRRR